MRECYSRAEVAAWSDPDPDGADDGQNTFRDQKPGDAIGFVMAGLAHAYCDNLLTDKVRAFEIECLMDELKPHGRRTDAEDE